MNKKAILATAILLAVVVICGCKVKAPYSVVPVTGTATWKGEPIPVGFRVEFEPTDGSRSSFGNIQEGGQFEAVHSAQQKGVKTGPCKVRVYWNDPPEINPVPEEYVEMIEKYGMTGPDAPEIEIKGKTKGLKIEFP